MLAADPPPAADPVWSWRLDLPALEWRGARAQTEVGPQPLAAPLKLPPPATRSLDISVRRPAPKVASQLAQELLVIFATGHSRAQTGAFPGTYPY
jgi:hypothetical protein